MRTAAMKEATSGAGEQARRPGRRHSAEAEEREEGDPPFTSFRERAGGGVPAIREAARAHDAPAARVDEWVEAFEQKRAQILEGRCPA